MPRLTMLRCGIWQMGRGPGPEPTPEEIATPEPTSVDVSERLAEVRSETSTVSEEFRRDTGAWTMDSDENVEYRIASRELSILVNKEDWMGWSINNEINAGDLLVEVDTVLADGPTVSEYGILFRYQDNQNFYFFAISSDSGAYSLWKEVDGEWTETCTVDRIRGDRNRCRQRKSTERTGGRIVDHIVGQR
jgi:hypothetical protein